ncbi:hypothetical protein [Streptomyces decoyicus]|uniref:hypothetical protein n=1 Tax=Streptomyces decoyicus TaxID=249567 RepID=UPI003868C26C|nr:hypothetical protein OG532_02645 [Streptomyces decoyicus]
MVDSITIGCTAVTVRARSPAATVTRGRFEGVVTTMVRRYAQRVDDVAHREKAEQSPSTKTCPERRGMRRPEGRSGITFTGPMAVDAARLIQVRCRSVDLGNTVLVIEHDLDVIHAVDLVIRPKSPAESQSMTVWKKVTAAPKAAPPTRVAEAGVPPLKKVSTPAPIAVRAPSRKMTAAR